MTETPEEVKEEIMIETPKAVRERIIDERDDWCEELSKIYCENINQLFSTKSSEVLLDDRAMVCVIEEEAYTCRASIWRLDLQEKEACLASDIEFKDKVVGDEDVEFSLKAFKRYQERFLPTDGYVCSINQEDHTVTVTMFLE